MADNKVTPKDYLDFFANKSAEADMLVEQLTRQLEDQRFGTIKPKMTYMQKVKAFNDDPMNQMIMGLVEPLLNFHKITSFRKKIIPQFLDSNIRFSICCSSA